MKITVVHAPSDTIEFVLVPHHYATKGYAHLVPSEMDFVAWAKGLADIEKEKNDWIRAYENVLKGLRYWESRAKESGLSPQWNGPTILAKPRKIKGDEL